MWIKDRLENLVSGLGMAKDKAANDSFVLRELMEHQIDAMCDGDWVARKIVDLPVKDTFRVWRTWNASGKHVNTFEEAEKRHGVRRKIAHAMKLARRYGGSVILIGADVADPSKPLHADAVKKGGLKYLTVLPRRNIVPNEIDRDAASPTYGEPLFYTLATQGAGSTVQIHASRVIRFVGAERFDLAGEALGWGYSALQAPYDAVHHTALSSGAAASMIHEAKVDVINVKNLGSVLQSDEGTKSLLKRFSLANMMKSINNTLVLDENETWNRVTTSFSGIPDLLTRFLNTAAAAADIPASRFLAQSASSGLHSSGDTDIRHYYDHLAAERERVIVPALDRLDDLVWRDATGKAAPKTAAYVWDALWQPTDKEKAETEKVMADVAKTYADAALFDEVVLGRGVLNGLIERGVFPGLEHAANESSALSNDPTGEPATGGETPKAGKTAARAADTGGRGRFARMSVVRGSSDWNGSTAPAF